MTTLMPFASALAFSVASSPMDCSSLVGVRIPDGTLLSAVTVAQAGGLPAYCRVMGVVRPAVNFEIRLPLADWNGKFYMVGCGGFCGTLDSDRPATGKLDVSVTARDATVTLFVQGVQVPIRNNAATTEITEGLVPVAVRAQPTGEAPAVSVRIVGHAESNGRWRMSTTELSRVLLRRVLPPLIN